MTGMQTKTEAHRHQNAFDALRIGAAIAVLYGHSYPLYGQLEPRPMEGQTIGSLAVAVFFSLSGFLVCQSWLSDASLLRFSMRRALRIFPGLFIVTVVTALVIGPAFSTLPSAEYFRSKEVWIYIVSSASALGNPSLPGVFENNPYPNAVNGSLWTLRYEIIMYACLAVAGKLVGKQHLKAACPALLGTLALIWLWTNAHANMSVQLPLLWRLTELNVDRIAYLGAFFFAGACALVYREHIRLSPVGASMMLATLAFIPSATVVMMLLWIAIPYAVCSFAFHSPAWVSRANGYDYSYGIYIYAFPVQQAVSLLGQRHGWPWIYVLSISAAVTTIAAALSWYLVEKPALSFKHLIGKRSRESAPASDRLNIAKTPK